MKLKGYQQEALALIREFGGRALLADEMGLGKTATALSWVLENKLFPCLIVCQASVIPVFDKEIRSLTNRGCIVTIKKSKPMDIPKGEGMFIIVSYDMLGNWIKELKSTGLRCVILDESQLINNPQTARAKNVKRVCHDVASILALSGTPFKNKELELFFILNLLKPYVFRTREDLKKYIKLGVLNTLLTKTIMIRRLKKDYLYLPEKKYTVVPFKISNKNQYVEVERNFIFWLREHKKGIRVDKVAALMQMEKLKQLAMEGKQNDLLIWLKNRLNNPGKIVCMFNHRSPLNFFRTQFPNTSVHIDGRVPTKARKLAVERFMNDPTCRLFFGNGKAAGTGITLTSADTEIIVEFPWTPADIDQWSDRIHRIGQNSNKVDIVFPVAVRTIEERIARIIDNKRGRFDGTIDNRRTEREKLITELIRSYS